MTFRDWSVWRDGVFGDPYLVWHDGPDFHYLAMTAHDDLDQVSTMLALGIKERDPLAAQSIAALAGAGITIDGAEALLRSAVPTAGGTFLVRLAEALRAVTGDQAWSGPIVSVLTSSRDADWYPRLDAARALAGFRPTSDLVQALGHGVCDPEYLVRYHSANTLLRYAGRAGQISDHKELFGLITSDSDRDSWQSAAVRLTAAVG
ncbi:hypothetical protein [Flindersiella endophytica]